MKNFNLIRNQESASERIKSLISNLKKTYWKSSLNSYQLQNMSWVVIKYKKIWTQINQHRSLTILLQLCSNSQRQKINKLKSLDFNWTQIVHHLSNIVRFLISIKTCKMALKFNQWNAKSKRALLRRWLLVFWISIN